MDTPTSQLDVHASPEPEDDRREARTRLDAASGTADPVRGEKVAREACTMCHKLPDGSGTAAAPALAELMQSGPISAARLGEVMAQSQHAFAKTKVTPADYPHLTAYLGSLL